MFDKFPGIVQNGKNFIIVVTSKTIYGISTILVLKFRSFGYVGLFSCFVEELSWDIICTLAEYDVRYGAILQIIRNYIFWTSSIVHHLQVLDIYLYNENIFVQVCADFNHMEK